MLCLLKGFDGLCSIFWNNISYVLMCAYVISSINSGKTLQDLNVFTLIAVFNTMTFPLGILPWTINSSLLSYVSLKRISKFLDTQEIDQDDRFQLPYPQSQASDVILIEDLICEWPIERIE
jgi:ATP-binding cassette subfamily C (CFTR/MRP) protein 1